MAEPRPPSPPSLSHARQTAKQYGDEPTRLQLSRMQSYDYRAMEAARAASRPQPQPTWQERIARPVVDYLTRQFKRTSSRPVHRAERRA